MSIYVAFLRGMNLGRRRIRNDELCACFEDMGLTGVSAFLASGNVIFDGGDRAPEALGPFIEEGLKARLDYAVPTYLRSAAEIGAIADKQPFTAAELADSEGKAQVILFGAPIDAAAQAAARAATPGEDRLAFDDRELYWLPKGRMSDSGIDMKALERALGGTTVRTHRTVIRLRAKIGG